MKFWSAIELLAGRGGVPAVWEQLTAQPFDTLSFLRSTGRTAAVYPCPHGCGCQHEVVRHQDGSIIAVCACPWGGCGQEITLGLGQLQVYEINVPHLGRAIVRALECDPRLAETGTRCTWQIGSYSAAALPLLLVIAPDPHEFRLALTELTARLRSRFLLFAPTSGFLEARGRELLANAGAAFFDLASHFRATSHGTLHALRSPGELLGPFAPPTAPEDEEVARRAFALIQQLDSSSPARPPSVLTVFRLYCIDELTAGQVARQCRCSKTTVVDRLKLIRKITGAHAQQLRRFSAHFGTIEAAATDSRAAHIHRKRLIDDTDEEE